MDTYLKMQSSNNKVEFNLKKKMNQLRSEMQKATTLILDTEEFIQLMFFSDFSIEKYLQEKLMLEKKDAAFLKSMNPNGELNEKVEQLRIKEKKKMARLQSTLKRDSDSGSTISSLRRGSKMEVLLRKSPSLEDLGPAENYLHLIDPDLKKGDEPIMLDKAQEILTNLNQLESLNALMTECQVLLSKDRSKVV